MNRRRFLGLAGAGIGGAALSALPRVAWGSFGTFPVAAEHLILPLELQAKNVLEIFLYGGLSMWESVYHVDDLIESYMRDERDRFLGDCGVMYEPVAFGTDALGATVQVGPFAHALWARPDVTSRMRVVTTSHDIDPHEAAIPLTLTGKPVGNPLMAGLGSHIQRYFSEREPERRTPFSYVLRRSAAEESDAALEATQSTGTHPSTVRPLRINVDAAGRLTDLLDRPGAGTLEERANVDALLGAYLDQYERRVVWNGETLRSPRIDDVNSAMFAVSNADALAEVLDPSVLVPIENNVCGVAGLNIPAMSLKLAAHLLTHPEHPARYACVVDSGIVATLAGGYDAHGYPYNQAHNLHNVLSELLSIINEPGEGDPTKLELDDTLVIINTEFGRTRDQSSNHLPQAYLTTLIGGPITSAQAGAYGAIGADSVAVSPLQPSDNRIGALLALGIYPFSTDSFAVADATGAISETHGVELVTQNVLGHTP